MNLSKIVKWLVVGMCAVSLAWGCGDDDDGGSDDSSGGLSAGGGLGGLGGGSGSGSGGGGATNLTCPELHECATSCSDGDEACIDDCTSRAAPGSEQTLATLYRCVSDAGCTEGQCLVDNCQPEYEACFGPIPDNGGGGQCPIPAHSGQLNCGQLLQCLDESPSDTCSDQCIQESSDTGAQQLSNLLDCYNTNCSNSSSDTCISDYCAAELQSCDGL